MLPGSGGRGGQVKDAHAELTAVRLPPTGAQPSGLRAVRRRAIPRFASLPMPAVHWSPLGKGLKENKTQTSPGPRDKIRQGAWQGSHWRDSGRWEVVIK